MRITEKQRGCFAFPRDKRPYGEVLLSAALPDDDFQSFTVATAILLLDRIQGGAGEDNLYWNWDAFADHFRMADPQVRALLMNGFRVAAAAGAVKLPELPSDADCLTHSADRVLQGLTGIGAEELADAIRSDIDPVAAGRLWTRRADQRLARAEFDAFRHLFERPQSIAPDEPQVAPLIPWG